MHKEVDFHRTPIETKWQDRFYDPTPQTRRYYANAIIQSGQIRPKSRGVNDLVGRSCRAKKKPRRRMARKAIIISTT